MPVKPTPMYHIAAESCYYSDCASNCPSKQPVHPIISSCRPIFYEHLPQLTLYILPSRCPAHEEPPGDLQHHPDVLQHLDIKGEIPASWLLQTDPTHVSSMNTEFCPCKCLSVNLRDRWRVSMTCVCTFSEQPLCEHVPFAF